MPTPHLSASLRHVVEAATLAPSVHNTQPWRFMLRPTGFDLLADPGRRLAVLDPTGRLLHLSCGAAVLTARVAARALGLDARVDLLPDADDPQLLARVTLASGAPADGEELPLALAVLKRHTVRGVFDPTPLPAELLGRLRRVPRVGQRRGRLGDAPQHGLQVEVAADREHRLEQRVDAVPRRPDVRQPQLQLLEQLAEPQLGEDQPG